jgi:hypothetical protein
MATKEYNQRYYATHRRAMKAKNRAYYLANKCRLDARSKRLYEQKILILKLERGGRCERCGYNRIPKILQFHHIGKKRFSVSSGNKHRSLQDLRREAGECQLLCPTCHYELTFPD